MAGETVVQPTAAPAETQQIVRYTVTELKAAAKKQFGCGQEVIDGAIYGKEETEYSVDEMKALIETFLHKPIKDGGK